MKNEDEERRRLNEIRSDEGLPSEEERRQLDAEPEGIRMPALSRFSDAELDKWISLARGQMKTASPTLATWCDWQGTTERLRRQDRQKVNPEVAIPLLPSHWTNAQVGEALTGAIAVSLSLNGAVAVYFDRLLVVIATMARHRLTNRTEIDLT